MGERGRALGVAVYIARTLKDRQLTGGDVAKAYHGTPHIEKVLREGLLARYAVDGAGNTGSCPHIWLARRPEDAEASGDVVEVDMTGISGGFEEGAWQGCYHGGDLKPERLRAYRERRGSR